MAIHPLSGGISLTGHGAKTDVYLESRSRPQSLLVPCCGSALACTRSAPNLKCCKFQLFPCSHLAQLFSGPYSHLPPNYSHFTRASVITLLRHPGGQGFDAPEAAPRQQRRRAPRGVQGAAQLGEFLDGRTGRDVGGRGRQGKIGDGAERAWKPSIFSQYHLPPAPLRM